MLNAAAYTDVDGAETPDGRVAAWRANAIGPAVLARVAAAHGLTLVHLSSEYVFDGRAEEPYAEDAPIAPLSAYGASKAAGDLAVGGLERHYLVRPTWVVGDGRNFVRTMLGLAARGISPPWWPTRSAVRRSRSDIAAAVVHLLRVAGAVRHLPRHRWRRARVLGRRRPGGVHRGRARCRAGDATPPPRSTSRGKPGAAPRPLNSVLDCTKAAKAGVDLPDWRTRLPAYIRAAP